MEPPEVILKSWIKLGSNDPFRGLDGYVLRIFSPGHLSVGYYQNRLKTIRADVIWNGSYWEFEHPHGWGSYLGEPEAGIVKRGPYA